MCLIHAIRGLKSFRFVKVVIKHDNKKLNAEFPNFDSHFNVIKSTSTLDKLYMQLGLSQEVKSLDYEI